MSILKTTVPAVVACMALACTSTGNQAEKLADVSVPTVSVSAGNNASNWHLTTETTNTDFLKENIDSIILIPLETNEQCMVGHISHLFMAGDTLIVVDPSKSQKILKFNRNGEFISTIGSKGEGPDEYGTLNDVYISGDSIYVNDWIKSQFISYSINSDEASTINMKQRQPQNMMKLNDSIFAGTYASYFSNNPFAVEWLDKDGVSVGSARPFKYTRSAPAGELKKLNDGRVLYYRSDCDTIFEVKQNELIPTFTLGLGNDYYAFVEETLDLSDPDFNKKLMTDASAPLNHFDIVEFGDDWFVNYQKGAYTYIAVVDGNTNASKCYLRSDIKNKSINTPFVIYEGNDKYLLSYIDETFKELVSDQDKQRIYDTYPYIKDAVENHNYNEENTILCLLKCKGTTQYVSSVANVEE